MRKHLPLLLLTAMIVALGLLAALAGLFWTGAPPPAPEVASVRGQTVTLYGRGVYRYNPLMQGAGFPAQDVVFLAVLPLLGGAAWAFARGSRRAAVPLLGALGYCLYVYASMALGAALDWLFPAYVVLFSACLFAMWLAARATLPRLDPPVLPGRALAVFIGLAGIATFLIWAPALIAELAAGRVPERLYTQTTKVTHALDLALIVPLCLVSALLVLRRDPLGYAIVLPLLGLIVGLFPWIVLATVLQIRAGVDFSLPEMIGPIGGFLVLGAGGAWFLWQVWTALGLPRSEPGPMG